MATVISKMRKEFYNEQKMKKDIMSEVKIERTKPTLQITTTNEKFKMTIDPKKLESTIQKACMPVKKKCIALIDTVPVLPPHSHKNPVAVVFCHARNLNGTPCKCKAKIGKFCAKHAP